ncbi:hypothetical protein [Chromobacterium amazonense]|uniref:hypothetical protein n=1 Tax=Chromobacterium amazonense TaxID=1382803 RepID=UPI0031F6C8A8
MGVPHGHDEVVVAQRPLPHQDVAAVHHEVTGKAVTKDVGQPSRDSVRLARSAPYRNAENAVANSLSMPISTKEYCLAGERLTQRGYGKIVMIKNVIGMICSAG